MAEARERIGFVGLGSMGAPLAGHLLMAGYPLTVFARRPGAAAALVADGARQVPTLRELGERSDLVFTMVTDTADVEAVLFGDEGIAAGMADGGLVVDLSTIAPSAPARLAARLAGRGIGFLDAPVSGGPEGARNGALTIMAGGAADALARATPALSTFSARILHMGPSGAGQATKACHQLLLLITADGVAEALALAAKAGVNPGQVREVMLNAMASSRVLDRFGGQMAARNFTPGIPAKLYQKDIAIVRAFAREVGAPLPAGEVVEAQINRLVASGRADEDLSVLITTLE